MRQFLYWIDNHLDNWLFHGFPFAPEGLALYRISFAVYALVFGVPSFVWISANPDVFFDPPPSIALFFSGFPSYAAFQVVSTLVCLLFILLLFGYNTRIVSIVLTLALIVANSFKYSFGKIDHDIIPVLTPFVMSFSGWGACLSLDSLRKRNHRYTDATQQNWPVALMAFIIAFGFFSAGLPKALKWIDFDMTTNGVRSWVTAVFFIEGSRDLLVPVFVGITNSYFWEVLDIMAVVFEIGFIVALPFPRLFRIYIGLAVLFHLNNHLMLNIPFAEYMVVYLLFLNWEPVLSYLKEKSILVKIQNMFGFQFLLLFTVAYLPFYYAAQAGVTGTSARTSSLFQFFVPDAFGLSYRDLRGVIVVFAAAAIVLWIAISKIWHLFAQLRTEHTIEIRKDSQNI